MLSRAIQSRQGLNKTFFEITFIFCFIDFFFIIQIMNPLEIAKSKYLSETFQRYEKHIAYQTKRAVLALALSAIFLLGSLYLFLSLNQVFPGPFNLISGNELWKYAIACSLFSTSLLSSIVFSVNLFVKSCKHEKDINKCLKLARETENIDQKFSCLTQAVVLSHRQMECQKEILETLSDLKKEGEQEDELYRLSFSLAESAFARQNYSIVLLALDLVKKEFISIPHLILKGISLFQEMRIEELKTFMFSLSPIEVQQTSNFLRMNHSLFLEKAALGSLFGFFGEINFHKKDFDHARALFWEAKEWLLKNHKVLLLYCNFYLEKSFKKKEEMITSFLEENIDSQYKVYLAQMYFELADYYCDQFSSRFQMVHAFSILYYGDSIYLGEVKKASTFYQNALKNCDENEIKIRFSYLKEKLTFFPEQNFHLIQKLCLELSNLHFKNGKFLLSAYLSALTAISYPKHTKLSELQKLGIARLVEALEMIEIDECRTLLLDQAISCVLKPNSSSYFPLTSFLFSQESEQNYSVQEIRLQGKLHLFRARLFEKIGKSKFEILQEYKEATRWAPLNPLGHEPLEDSSEANNTQDELILIYKHLAEEWNDFSLASRPSFP